MKTISFWRKLLASIASLVLIVAVNASPATADVICTVRGGKPPVKSYAEASRTSRPIGSLKQGTSIKVKREFFGDALIKWAEYESSNTTSKLAYIPSADILCKFDMAEDCKDDYRQGYSQGYNQGVADAKKALNRL
jgi:hypothetical protein